MTTVIETCRGDVRRAVGASATARAAAMYTEVGWPVLPGSVFDGRRYVVAGTYRATDGLRPVLPRDRASTDAATVAQWWRVATPLDPSVLVCTGRAFEAVSVSRELAVEAIQTQAFRDAPGPVIMRPDQGRAYFLVGLGESVLPPEDARPSVVEPMRPGSWLAVPPTRTAVGAVMWLAAPRFAGWRPISAGVLVESLRLALPRVASAGWGG